MQLDRIISMANEPMRLQFLAMERSLRAAGCTLPMSVIPYDDRRFDLPHNAEWWFDESIAGWLGSRHAHPTMRKYQCLTIGAFHFADADIIFLSDPAVAVARFEGLVTACTEWNKPQWTFTPESASYFYQTSSTWQQRVFSTGQFAIDRPLYNHATLFATANHPTFRPTTIEFPLHEQPGLNQLVIATGVDITNLTLTPHGMQSTWAGDYPGSYNHLWVDQQRKPYMIHWAGSLLDSDRPINELFYSFLTQAERKQWDEQQAARRTKARIAYRSNLPIARRLVHDVKQIAKRGLAAFGVDSNRRAQRS